MTRKIKPHKRKFIRQKKVEVLTPIINRGRPRIENRDRTLTALKPWVAAKMSRATWYKRQKETAVK